MMDVTPLLKAGQQVIQSYKNGVFKISGQIFDSPVIVFCERTYIWDITSDINDLCEDDFKQIFSHADELDVILLGCGDAPIFIPPQLRQIMSNKSMQLESMDTSAACRTYNVMMAEGRRVCAALYPYKS